MPGHGPLGPLHATRDERDLLAGPCAWVSAEPFRQNVSVLYIENQAPRVLGKVQNRLGLPSFISGFSTVSDGDGLGFLPTSSVALKYVPGNSPKMSVTHSSHFLFRLYVPCGWVTVQLPRARLRRRGVGGKLTLG